MAAEKNIRTVIPSKQMPHSIESELALLGSIILRPPALDNVSDIIQPGDFYKAGHRKVYEAMLGLSKKGEAIDFVTITAWLEKAEALEQAGGMEFLSELTENVPTSHNIRSYAKIIADKARLRALLEAAWGIIEEGYTSKRDVSEILEEAEHKIFEVGQREIQSTLTSMDDIVIQSMTHLDQFSEGGQTFTGVPTGFSKLDDLTNGLQKGELTVIAARPSMGKSAFAFNIATNVAIGSGLPVVIFTLEMSAVSCGVRMLCSQAGVDIQKLRNGEATTEDFKDFTRAAAMLSEAPIFIDDAGLIGTDEIRAKCRRMKARHDIGLVIIDYLQLLKVRRGVENREQQISDMSRSLKALAKELNVPVVCISQLNRAVENREDKRPRLADIRESGAVEQDADMIAFIYRHEYYHEDDEESHGKAEVILAKNRNGPTGKVEIQFDKRFARFRDLERYRDDPH